MQARHDTLRRCAERRRRVSSFLTRLAVDAWLGDQGLPVREPTPSLLKNIELRGAHVMYCRDFACSYTASIHYCYTKYFSILTPSSSCALCADTRPRSSIRVCTRCTQAKSRPSLAAQRTCSPPPPNLSFSRRISTNISCHAENLRNNTSDCAHTPPQ